MFFIRQNEVFIFFTRQYPHNKSRITPTPPNISLTIYREMPRLDYRSNPERDRNHRCRRRQYRRLVPNYRPICPNRFPYRRHSQNERRGRIGTKLRNSAGNGAVHSVCRRGRPLSPRRLRTASEKSASDQRRHGHHAVRHRVSSA